MVDISDTQQRLVEAASPLADADHTLEVFAAELTAAVYPIALRHGGGDRWLDLELALWRVLTETVKKWGREVPRA